MGEKEPLSSFHVKQTALADWMPDQSWQYISYFGQLWSPNCESNKFTNQNYPSWDWKNFIAGKPSHTGFLS